MSRKELNQKEKEARDKQRNQKFKDVVNPRLNKLRYEIGRIVKMTSQPNYIIYDVDAKKILDGILPEIEHFIDVYSKISRGEKLTTSKKEIKNIF